MAVASNRANVYTKAHRVLKKHFKPVAPPNELTVLEAILYACCLEDAPYEKTDAAVAKLREHYFDWNEVRVTTVTELREVMSDLSDARRAAGNLKRALQSIFENQYSFDLEELRKQNLGKAVKLLEKYDGVTPFVVGYVVQSALGGHAVPVDRGVLETMYIVGAIDEKEKQKKVVPGMERAIPKSKGVEFGSLLHQLAAEFTASPFSPRVRGILLEIAPDAKQRFPKRSRGKDAAAKKTTPAKGTRKKAATKSTAKKSAKSTAASTKTAKKASVKAKSKGGSRKLTKRKPK